jgi:hypothetical protein
MTKIRKFLEEVGPVRTHQYRYSKDPNPEITVGDTVKLTWKDTGNAQYGKILKKALFAGKIYYVKVEYALEPGSEHQFEAGEDGWYETDNPLDPVKIVKAHYRDGDFEAGEACEVCGSEGHATEDCPYKRYS